jgi:hypothetical protein
MVDRSDGIKLIRESAERLRRIASENQTAVSPELMRMARELDQHADKLEADLKLHGPG